MRYKTATQWGVYEVEVTDGQITDVQGITADPAPAPMANTLLDVFFLQHRLKRQLIAPVVGELDQVHSVSERHIL